MYMSACNGDFRPRARSGHLLPRWPDFSFFNKKHIDFIEGASVHLNNARVVSIGKSYRHLAKSLVE